MVNELFVTLFEEARRREWHELVALHRIRASLPGLTGWAAVLIARAMRQADQEFLAAMEAVARKHRQISLKASGVCYCGDLDCLSGGFGP